MECTGGQVRRRVNSRLLPCWCPFRIRTRSARVGHHCSNRQRGEALPRPRCWRPARRIQPQRGHLCGWPEHNYWTAVLAPLHLCFPTDSPTTTARTSVLNRVRTAMTAFSARTAQTADAVRVRLSASGLCRSTVTAGPTGGAPTMGGPPAGLLSSWGSSRSSHSSSPFASRASSLAGCNLGTMLQRNNTD